MQGNWAEVRGDAQTTPGRSLSESATRAAAERARALMARAAAQRSGGEYARARETLTKAFDLSERLDLKRELADCVLECTRILLLEGRPDSLDKADDCLDGARRLIEQSGYERRDADLHLLAADLKLKQGYADLAHAALVNAIAIVRKGWWGHLPEITRLIEEGGYDNLRPALRALQQRQVEYDRIADAALEDSAFRDELARTLAAIDIATPLDEMPRHAQRHYAIELLDAKASGN